MDTPTTASSIDTGRDAGAADGTVPTYGVAIDAGGDLGGLYADDTGVHVFTEPPGGSPVSADLPAGADRVAVAGIDGTGAVYGTYTLPDGNGGTSTYSFEDSGGIVTPIAGPNGAAGTAVRSVNAAGAVLGTYVDGGGNKQAFTLTGMGAAPITIDGLAPASIASLAPIDDLGDIAGVYLDADGTTTHSFLADGKDGATVAALDGYTVTSLVGGAGAVAGTLSEPNGPASAFYLSTKGELSVIAPVDGMSNVQPVGFDAGGDVVGTYTDGGGATQSFIAFPSDDGSDVDVEAFTFAGTLPTGAALQATRIIGTDAAGGIFGTYTYLDGGGASHTAGFVFSGGTFATLPSGAAFAQPTGFADAGGIVALGDDGAGGTLIDRGGIAAPLTVPGRVRATITAGVGVATDAGDPGPIAGVADRSGSGAGPVPPIDRPSATPTVGASAPVPAFAIASTPAPLPAPAAASPPAPPADAVSLSPQVSYARGAFTLLGTASSPAGVAGVEITATVAGGQVEDLGPAALNPDGTFSLSAWIGRRVLSFLTATATDRAGGAASATGSFALTGGFDRDGFVAEQDVYTPDGAAVASTTQFSAQGDRVTQVYAPGQTFTSEGADTFDDGRFGNNAFVFDPGHGASVVEAFRLNGPRHDTLGFSGADFGGSVARLLRDSADAADGSGVVITDPTTRDTVELVGFSKQQLVGHPGDIAFRA